MKRKYGDEQRKSIEIIKHELINELNDLYLSKFNQLNNSGLGDGAIASLTQLLLMSRSGAITPLEDDSCVLK